jgi:exosortase/archaeosortase family protein
MTHEGAAQRRWAAIPLRSLALFLAMFLVLQTGWESLRGSAIEHLVIDDATAGSAAWLIRTLTPSIPAVAQGSHVTAPGKGINILNGCEGTEVLFLLLPALCVATLTWRRRLMGFLIGTALVFVLNQVRVVSLFYALRSDPQLFDALHGTVAPLLLVLSVTAFFALYTRPSSR